MKAIKWLIWFIALVLVILPIEMITYYGEIRFAEWLKNKLDI